MSVCTTGRNAFTGRGWEGGEWTGDLQRSRTWEASAVGDRTRTSPVRFFSGEPSVPNSVPEKTPSRPEAGTLAPASLGCCAQAQNQPIGVQPRPPSSGSSRTPRLPAPAATVPRTARSPGAVWPEVRGWGQSRDSLPFSGPYGHLP